MINCLFTPWGCNKEDNHHKAYKPLHTIKQQQKPERNTERFRIDVRSKKQGSLPRKEEKRTYFPSLRYQCASFFFQLLLLGLQFMLRNHSFIFNKRPAKRYHNQAFHTSLWAKHASIIPQCKQVCFLELDRRPQAPSPFNYQPLLFF